MSISKYFIGIPPAGCINSSDRRQPERVSQFFVLPTCAAIDLSFNYYYSINLKSLLLNLRDRHKSF